MVCVFTFALSVRFYWCYTTTRALPWAVEFADFQPALIDLLYTFALFHLWCASFIFKRSQSWHSLFMMTKAGISWKYTVKSLFGFIINSILRLRIYKLKLSIYKLNLSFYILRLSIEIFRRSDGFLFTIFQTITP